jgi:hypothetical protein
MHPTLSLISSLLACTTASLLLAWTCMIVGLGWCSVRFDGGQTNMLKTFIFVDDSTCVTWILPMFVTRIRKLNQDENTGCCKLRLVLPLQGFCYKVCAHVF